MIRILCGVLFACAMFSRSVLACIPGTPPTVAAANGLNCSTYSMDFSTLSTIDTTNSGNPGFNLYGLNPFGYASTPGSDYSIASNVLSLTDTPGPGVGLESVAFINPAAVPATYVGTTFKPPFYIEYTIAANQSLAPGAQKSGIVGCGFGVPAVNRVAWPAFWLQDVNWTAIQTVQTSDGNPHSEIDAMEFAVNCPGGSGAGTWQIQNNLWVWQGSWTGFGGGTGHSVTPAGPWDGTTQHTEGLLVIDTVTGGGTGSVIYYHDGAAISTTTFSTNPQKFAVDNANYELLIASGFSWPFRVGPIKVWQVADIASISLLTLEPGVVGQSTTSGSFAGYPMTGYGTYSGIGAPSSATGTWTGCGGGAATVTSFSLNPYPVGSTGASNSGAAGTFTVGVNAPATAGTGCTLTITTNTGVTATSPPTNVAADTHGTLVTSNIHNAPGWLHSHAYAPASGPKTRVNNGAGWTESTGTWNPGSLLRAYELTSGSCTSAASGGPTGTGSTITDGTCTWKYLSDTDYITITGWQRDAPAWAAKTYAYDNYVTTNTGGNYRAYMLDSSDGGGANTRAFCTSTVAPSGVGATGNAYASGFLTTADGCTWSYMGDIVYSSQASTMPFNTYSGAGFRTSHLTQPYTALLWNDREYVGGTNGELSPIIMTSHQGNGPFVGGETLFVACNGPTFMTDCPTITIKPADGEGFASSLTPSTPLTGYDPTKGVAISDLGATQNTGFSYMRAGLVAADFNLTITGLQFKSTVSDGLFSVNWETITDNIIDGGFNTDVFSTFAAVRVDVPGIIANNLILNHGQNGIAFKYGSSVALFNTIANVGSHGDAVLHLLHMEVGVDQSHSSK